MKVILSIEGMSCSACSNGLEKYLQKQNGIIKATVNLVMATAQIEYEENITLEDLNRFVEEAGFTSLGIANLETKKKKESIVPFIIFGILAVLLMYISMSHMGYFPLPAFLNMHTNPLSYSFCLLVMTIPFLFYGFSILKSGVKNFIHKMPNMDTLVSIGVFSSFLYSFFGVVLIFLGHHEYVKNLYFESTAFVLYFIKLGRFIESHAQEKTKSAIQKLVTITPKTAKLKTKDGYKEVTIDEVKKDDILICLAGDKIAVDGTVLDGETHVDESFITGESKPVKKNISDKVIAGSVNYEGVILYKAEKIGKDSTISEIVRLVVEATNTKAPIAKLADQISRYFVPIILIISLFTFIINFLIGFSFSVSLTRFVTVLVVACPCALGLATPLAIVVSEGVCAKNGILVKTSAILEMASKIDTVVFDKTGTLTNGNLTIFKMINYSSYQENKLYSFLGALEKNSTHPIAQGIIRSIQEKNIKIQDELKVENIEGFGIKGIDQKKNVYYACNGKYLKKLKIKNNYIKDEELLTKEGCSIVYLICNKEILALIGLKDSIRKNAKEVIQQLIKQNIEVLMLTGDNQMTAMKVAKELGIQNVISDVVPKEKGNAIQNLKNQNKKVMMIGDGINDAPSLTLASIGCSISSGTDIATDSADVVFMQDDLMKVFDLLLIGKRTLKNIKENLFWAFIYNLCMIPIASGLFTKWNFTINPMIACIAMIFSSFFVVLNALRLRRIKLRK